jgi:hypothetical protein
MAAPFLSRRIAGRCFQYITGRLNLCYTWGPKELQIRTLSGKAALPSADGAGIHISTEEIMEYPKIAKLLFGPDMDVF